MPSPYLTRERLWYAGTIFAAIIGSVALMPLSDLYKMAFILAFPAAAVSIAILRNPYIGTYLFFLYEFLRPYDFIPALQPLRLAILIVILTLFSWILYLIKNYEKIKWDKINWFYLLFMANLAIGTYLAANNFNAFRIFQMMAITFIMYIVTTNTVDSVKRFEKLWWLLICVHLFFAFSGIFNYIFNPGRASTGAATSGIVGSSHMADENDFAMALNVFIPFIIFSFLYYKNKLVRLFLTGSLVTYLMAVVTSLSRGGTVGLIGLTLFSIWYSGKRAVGFTILTFGIIIFLIAAPSSYLNEVQTITDVNEATANSRIEFWKASFRMFLAYPISGVGPGNGGMHMPEFIENMGDNTNRFWGRTFHGLFPQLIAETGATGVLLYIFIVYYVMTYLNRIRKREPINEDQKKLSMFAVAMMGSIIAFLVTATFLSTAYYPQFWTMVTLAMTVIWIQRKHDLHQNEIASLRQKANESVSKPSLA